MSELTQSCPEHRFSVKGRLWFSGLIVLHQTLLAIKLLSIDFTQAEQPDVQVYHLRRWKLITSWINLIMLSYYIITLYCDWRESRREDDWPHVKVINQVRSACFSNILFPGTFFTDTLFWRLWNTNRDLIMPKGIEAYVPYWIQHCLHTVSLVVVVIELIVTPRTTPKSLKPGIAMMYICLTAYIYMSYTNWIEGEYIYPCLGMMSTSKIICLVFTVYIEHLLYFLTQWKVVDLLWGPNNQNGLLEKQKVL